MFKDVPTIGKNQAVKFTQAKSIKNALVRLALNVSMQAI